MNNDNKDICQETEQKPVIDLLALWEEVEEMIQEKRALEGEKNMTPVMYNEVRIVIGSWGSYNAGNARAMGSKLITLSDYDDWEDIEEELERQGFQLDGIDEELFVQDVENLDLDGENTDYMSPRRLFETLRDSGVLLDTNKYDMMDAFLEVRSFSEFEALVDDYGESWDDDIHVYKGYGWEEYGREQFSNSGLSIPDSLIDYFDFESYGESFSYDGIVEKYSGGLIEIS